MPPGHGTEGLEAAQQIRSRWPSVGLLLLSQYVEAHYALQLMTDFEGGVGYLLKDRVSDLDAFALDVRRVATGSTVIDPELVASLVARRREEDPLESLTDRERDVLSLMAQGMSNAALADALHLSPKTIEVLRRQHLHQARTLRPPSGAPACTRGTHLPASMSPQEGSPQPATPTGSDRHLCAMHTREDAPSHERMGTASVTGEQSEDGVWPQPWSEVPHPGQGDHDAISQVGRRSFEVGVGLEIVDGSVDGAHRATNLGQLELQRFHRAQPVVEHPDVAGSESESQ